MGIVALGWLHAAAGAATQVDFVQAMRPHAPGKPVVAVLALNEGTEATDLLLPHAVLQRSGLAEVWAVAPRAGRVHLFPALQLQLPHDLGAFDRAHPQGADYVIVPAMMRDDDPAIIAWLQRQAASGARVIGICSGARVLGRAGLLDGRRFTGHWYDRHTLRQYPGSVHVPDQRYLADGAVATTTGITASIPATLALVQALGGTEAADTVARELGVADWGPAHDSAAFGLTPARVLAYAAGKLAFRRHDRRRIDVQDGTDDATLALVTDAWARTGRVSVEAAAEGPVRLRSGLTLWAQPAAEGTAALPALPPLAPVAALDQALCQIGRRYGTWRRDWVMLEMEYRGAAGC
jgi:putative intracellular protease/amidase